MADARDGTEDTRRRVKSDAAFRTISEVATELELPQHVLRFWETKFNAIKPMKRGGGRRYYRPEDVTLLRRIRALLYDDGYTIKGVQKLLREGGGRLPAPKAGAAPPAAAVTPSKVDAREGAREAVPAASSGAGDDRRRLLGEVARELEDIRALLNEAPA